MSKIADFCHVLGRPVSDFDFLSDEEVVPFLEIGITEPDKIEWFLNCGYEPETIEEYMKQVPDREFTDYARLDTIQNLRDLELGRV
jgi:hypothetical protein